MHVDFNISIGQLGIIVMLGGIFWKCARRVWEHDAMWADFCYRLGLKPNVKRKSFQMGAR
jgi:hypothetical protein